MVIEIEYFSAVVVTVVVPLALLESRVAAFHWLVHRPYPQIPWLRSFVQHGLKSGEVPIRLWRGTVLRQNVVFGFAGAEGG
jgi:hypothetical protein